MGLLSVRRLRRVWVLPGLAVLFAAVAPIAVAAAGQEIKTLITEQFQRYDPHYVETRERYDAKLEDARRALVAAEMSGRSLHCSQQLFLEAKWLHRYTAHWDRLEDKLRRVAASLEIQDQDFAARQSPIDGLWGVCHEEFFMRLAATAAGLEHRLEIERRPPAFELRPTGRLNSGRKVLEYMQRLLVSDIANQGVDNRGELGSLITTLSLGAFDPILSRFLIESVDLRSSERFDHVREAFRFFLAGAQDAETGYWGAWYIVDGRVIKTADLSITYHVVSYSKGQVGHWPRIARTTLAIENDPYPYGWKHDGRDNNHNFYDVASIFKHGWAHLSPDARGAVGRRLQAMLQWSLDNTVNDRGEFAYDPTFANSLAAEYYFGTSFLDVVGYWDPARRFWTEAPTDPQYASGEGRG